MNREMKRLIEAEMTKYPDVRFRFEPGGRHHRVVLALNGAERFVPYTSTKTDRRGMLDKITEVRHAIRRLRGAL